MVVQYKLSIVVLHCAIKTTRGSPSINGDLLMQFVFFPSKKEAKENVWGRCNVEMTILATEVEMMFGMGLDEIQETDQTYLQELWNQAPEHSRDTKSGGTTETRIAVISCIPSPLQSYLASPHESDRTLHIQCCPEAKHL